MANLSNINNKFLVTTGGNVLIGQTADAGKKLYVYNTASADVALLESTQVFSTLAFKSSTNASTVTIGIDGAGNAAFENKLAAGKITFVTNGAERMQIDSSGNTTITTISNQGGLTARSSQDNVIIGIDNTATGGLPWRLQSTGGSSGLGAGKLFLKVGGTETDTNLISFITDSSGNNIKMGVGITGPTAKLHIFERTANTAVGLKLQSYSWDASLSLINDQGTWEILNDRTGLGTNGTLAFYNGGYKMALTPAGNLGIGTTSPSSDISGSATVLQINDAANNNLASLALKAGTQGSKWEMAALSADALGFFDDGTERMRITSDGNTTFAKSADSNRAANSIKHADNDFLYIVGGAAGVSLNDDGEDTRIILFNNSNIRFDAGTKDNAMIIEGNTGNVQVNETVGQRRFNVYDATDAWIRLYCGSSADWIFGSNGSDHAFKWYNQSSNGVAGYKMNLASNGTLTVKGDVIAYGNPSDKRLKENIKPIDSALDKVSKLQGVTFDWKKSDSILDIKEDIGFIAQDVQKVLPELVRENEDGMLSMRHQGIAPILLEAIKELKAEIEELKNKPCNCNCK